MTIPGWAGRLCTLLLLALALLSFGPGASSATIALIDERNAAFVGMAQDGPFDTPITVYSELGYEQYFGGSTVGLANPYLYASVLAYFENGGYSLTIVRVADDSDAAIIGVDGGVPGARTGLQALRDVSASIVAIPGVTTQPVQTALLALCESMGDRIAILDPVTPTSVSAVTAQRAALSTLHGFGALYFPWVESVIPGAPSPMPPSAFAAGLLANTDPPVTPSGSVLGASGVSTAINSTQSGELTQLGINPIREFAGQGVQFFGARTLAGDPEWKYIPVRRRAISLSASLRTGTEWCLAEPNDAATWAQIDADANDFLHMLWMGGWFAGASPSQAYFARCDAGTMSPEDLAEGRTVLLVGFAPLVAGEFLILRIEHTRPPTTGVAPHSPALALRAPQPNPARGSVSLSFDLPAAGRVALSVHDVGGRLVRTIAAGERLASGRHERSWDGRDDGGRAVAPGVYLVRLQAGEGVLTRRVVTVR